MTGRSRTAPTACLLIGHGSRVAPANAVLLRVARGLRRLLPGHVVETCFLEAVPPDLQAGIDRCVAGGAGRVLLLPYFLYLGGHVGRDLPRGIARARRRHPGVRLALAPHLGFDRRLVAIVADRARRGARRAGWR